MHEILISGYDDEKKTFIIREYVNHTFKEIEVEQSAVVPYENGSYYGDNSVISLYRKIDATFHFETKAFLLQMRDFYESVNPYYRIGNVYGNYFNTWDKDFGFEAYERMLEYLQSKEWMDYRILRVIHEHFDGMKRKLMFLDKEKNNELFISDDLIAFYTDAALETEKLVILGAKQNILKDIVKRSETKNIILDSLKVLIEQEKGVLELFLKSNECKDL